MKKLTFIFIFLFITLSLAKGFLREGKTPTGMRKSAISQPHAKKEDWKNRAAEYKERLRRGEKGAREIRLREKMRENRILKRKPSIPINSFSFPASAESLNCRLVGKLGYFPGWFIEFLTTCLTEGDYTYLAGWSEWGIIPILKTDDPSNIQMKGYLTTEGYWLPSLWKEGNYLYAVGEGEDGGVLVIGNVTDPENPSVVTSLTVPDATLYDVVVQGNYAYIGDQKGFRVVDITTQPPTNVGYLQYDNPCWQIAVSGSYAYVIEDWTFFDIIDISDPTNPTEIGWLPIYDIWDCKIQGNYAFVCGEEGFYVIDISDPHNPSLVTQLADVYGLTMEIEGDYAYLAGEEAFIIDISDPENPILVCHLETDGEITEEGDALSVENRMIYLTGEDLLFIYDATDFGPPVVGSCGNWYGFGVDIQGDYAYAVSNSPAEFHIVDITTPEAPNEISSLTLNYPQDVVVSDRYAYVADADMGLRIIDFFDSNNPHDPYICGECPADWAMGVAFSFPYTYVADRNFGLRIIDVSDPSSPNVVGSYGGISANKVFVQNDLAYVGCEEGLYIINISDPSDPRFVGSFTGWHIWDVYVSGDYAYVVGYDEFWKKVFGIIDVSNPENPTLSSRIREGGDALFVLGDYAYVAHWDDLRIINITDRENPYRIGIANVGARDVRVRVGPVNTYGYVVGDGFKVIDLTDPTGGVFLAGEYEFEEGNEIKDVFVSGTYAYVASDSGLQVIKIVPRNNPQSVGKYILSGARALDVRNSYAYVLGWDSLYIIDISNPQIPQRRSTYPGYFWNAKVSDNYAYLMSNFLQILDISNPNSPAPRGSFSPDDGYLFDDIAISGSYVYIPGYNYSTSFYGFYVIDVSNPDEPSFVRFVSTGDFYPHSHSLSVFGNRLYLIGSIYPNAFLKIYDITNPENPNFLGQYQEENFWYTEVSVTRGGLPIKEYAFIVAYEKGLRVIDVSNPANPTLFGYYKPAYDEYMAVHAIGSYAYIGSTWGFSIIEASLPGYANWEKMPEVSGQLSNKKVKGGGGITALGENVYLILGNNTKDFMRYNINSNSWSVACSLPSGNQNKKVKKGAYIVDDEEYVYVFKGGGTNEFYKYDPSSNSWSPLNEPGFSKGMKGGFACYVNYGGNYIYAGSGASNNEWKRFNLGTGNWENALPQNLPCEKAKIGSGLTYADRGKIYFLQGGGKKNYFWFCDLSAESPTWVTLESLPLVAVNKKKKVKEGGCIEWFNGKVYAVKGGNTKEFWAYNPNNNSWQYLGDITEATKGIKCGRSLTSSEYASGLFCLIGNNTNEFFYYPASGILVKELTSAAMENVSEKKIGISVVPNPTKGLTKVYYHLPKKEVATLKIYNTLGSLVYSAKSDKGEFTVKKLPAGIYLLRLESASNGYKEDRKLVVVK
ncbi:MAG: T9SS type A sorting domain-containing protein [candidate division WOR-3 bacterium]